MIILTKEQIILLHAQLIKETGGMEGIRDEGLLDSAILSPFQSFDGPVRLGKRSTTGLRADTEPRVH